jgi:hypothetical protein
MEAKSRINRVVGVRNTKASSLIAQWGRIYLQNTAEFQTQVVLAGTGC